MRPGGFSPRSGLREHPGVLPYGLASMRPGGFSPRSERMFYSFTSAEAVLQ